MIADSASRDGQRAGHDAAEAWRAQTLQVVADLLRVERIVADAARELLESFGEAERCLRGAPGPVPSPLARAVAALQFEDMASQLLRSARVRLEVAALSGGLADFPEAGASSLARPLPAVEQDSVACGTVELF